jgi:hypothetical protein
VVTVAGIEHQPAVFYMGTTGGGVWKTDDAGNTWRNVSDRYFKTGSVGAIDVSDSDPNVVYVGMGESPYRINMSSYGDGVYRSTDAGATWTHVGLEATRQIAAVAVHPTNPEIAYVAAQGNHWAPSSDRGVYGTTDGGRTWTKLLAGANGTTGAVDLKLDPGDPNVVYAAMWDHQRTGWQLRSGGPGSGIFIYAAVEAERSQHGIYRSDDAGATWRLLNRSRHVSTRPWYYMHVVAEPISPGISFRLDLIDSNGRLVRSLAPPDSGVGVHRLVWVPPTVIVDAFDGEAPAYQVRPGRYRARLVVDGTTFEEPVEVRPDPRLPPAPAEAQAEKFRLLEQLTAVFDTMARTVNRFHAARFGLDSLARAEPTRRRGREAAALAIAIDRWEAGAIAREIEDGNDRVNFGGRLGFDLIIAIEWLDRSDPPVTAGFRKVTADLADR